MPSHDLPDGVELLDGGTSGMDLLDMVADRDCLIVADAVNAAGPAGRLIRLEDDEHQDAVRDPVLAAPIGPFGPACRAAPDRQGATPGRRHRRRARRI